MNRSALLQRLQGIYHRLQLGDYTLARKVAEWKRLAKAGDPRAKIAYNSLAALHWQRRDTLAFAKAEVFYNRLRAHERSAHTELRQIVARKNAGDKKASALFSTLKAVHHKRKASLWSNGPGAPQTGYHPMPSYNRVGIDIPGALGQLSAYGQQWAQPPQPSMYLPLTPQALTMLIQLFQQVLMAANRGGMDRSVRPMEDEAANLMAQANPALFSDAANLKNIFNTTPRPVVTSTVKSAILSSTAPLTSSNLTMRSRTLAQPFSIPLR